MPELLRGIHPTGDGAPRHTAIAASSRSSIEERLRRILEKMLDEKEFLSPYGIRALSRCPRATSVRASRAADASTASSYLPAESDSGMFGGNSNWRGPIWMPVNVLLIRALLQFYLYYGDDFTSRVSDRLGPA